MTPKDFIEYVVNLHPKYVLNGQQDDEFDCWGFTRLVQRKLFARDLPNLVLAEDSLSNWVKQGIELKERLQWVQIEKPKHGCLVSMSHASLPYHVGTWLDIDAGGVIHFTEKGGIQFQSIRELKLTGWYRFRYDAPRQNN